MSAAESVDGLLRSSQFAHGLIVGAAAAVVVRVGDTLVDRHPTDVGHVRRRIALIAIIPPLAVVGWLFVHHAGLHGALPAAAVIAVAALGGPLIAVLDLHVGDGRLTALGLTLSAAGVWTCVPDTEVARGVLGACVAATAVWFVGPRRHLGWVAVIAMCTGLAAAIAWGARGRPAAAIGAAGCLSLLALLPVMERLWRGSGRSLPSLPVLAAIDAVAVVLASRWIGLGHSIRTAALEMLVLVALEVVVVFATSRTPASRTPASRTPHSRSVAPGPTGAGEASTQQPNAQQQGRLRP